MKLCDRCKVPGCCLDYLSVACGTAREKWCPEVQPNRAELISNMSLDEMARQLVPMIAELCKDGVPNEEYTRRWLSLPPPRPEQNGAEFHAYRYVITKRRNN